MACRCGDGGGGGCGGDCSANAGGSEAREPPDALMGVEGGGWVDFQERRKSAGPDSARAAKRAKLEAGRLFDLLAPVIPAVAPNIHSQEGIRF